VKLSEIPSQSLAIEVSTLRITLREAYAGVSGEEVNLAWSKDDLQFKGLWLQALRPNFHAAISRFACGSSNDIPPICSDQSLIRSGVSETDESSCTDKSALDSPKKNRVRRKRNTDEVFVVGPTPTAKNINFGWS
jgi:hypothetical protein